MCVETEFKEHQIFSSGWVRQCNVVALIAGKNNIGFSFAKFLHLLVMISYNKPGKEWSIVVNSKEDFILVRMLLP